MAETFTWDPLIEPTGTGTFRVRSAQFGNGYKQVAGDGINNEVQSWPLSFRESDDEVQPILAFLRAHKGFIPFKWTPPLGEEALFTCGSWTLTPLGGELYTLACTFDQYFGVA